MAKIDAQALEYALSKTGDHKSSILFGVLVASESANPYDNEILSVSKLTKRQAGVAVKKLESAGIILCHREGFPSRVSVEITRAFPKNEKKPKQKKSYPDAFEKLWDLYSPDPPDAKGTKSRAYTAYKKAVEKFGEDRVSSAVKSYIESDDFRLFPAHLSTFLNGIVKSSKYSRYAAKHFTGRDESSSDTLDAMGLIRRTNEVQKALHEKFGTSPTVIEFEPRSVWGKILGPEYVAIKIPHPRNKSAKTNVLFTIDELRSNVYSNIHGIRWNSAYEKKYKEANMRDGLYGGAESAAQE